MSKPAPAKDPLHDYWVTRCHHLLKQHKCLTSLGGFEQRGPDPAFVDGPDRLDYLLHDVPVIILSPSEFLPGRQDLICCPGCKESSCVKTDGWEPNLRTAVGLRHSVGVLSRRYRCNSKSHGGE